MQGGTSPYREGYPPRCSLMPHAGRQWKHNLSSDVVFSGFCIVLCFLLKVSRDGNRRRYHQQVC